MNNLGVALRDAARQTEKSRQENRERINKKAHSKRVSVGDYVMVKANTRHPLTTRWDPVYVVTQARGSALVLMHQRSGVIRRANRQNVHLVDPNITWDEIPRRPRNIPIHPNERPQVLVRTPFVPEVDPVRIPQPDVVATQAGARPTTHTPGDNVPVPNILQGTNHPARPPVPDVPEEMETADPLPGRVTPPDHVMEEEEATTTDGDIEMEDAPIPPLPPKQRAQVPPLPSKKRNIPPPLPANRQI
jgi:hypothetical protein